MKASSYLQDELEARRTSLTITIFLLILLILLAYFWVVVRSTIPPPDENPYIVVGRIDFGANLGPKVARAPAPVPAAREPVITSPEPSPVQEPPEVNRPSPKPTPPEPQTAEEAPQETEEEEDTTEEVEVFRPGGNLQKSATEMGGGLIEFGEGDAGSENRQLIHFVLPKYQVQREARIKFELFIQPDGRVAMARALDLQAPPELKRAGEEAILQWRFTPITTNQIQRLTVFIRFRLR
ncbi:MAG: hypothetical protein ABDH91_05440 [Bacteroidia bacterium]